ncbi:3-phosphoshikimate 1-carboxyvinyltransferase [Clostridium sp. LBM24168]
METVVINSKKLGGTVTVPSSKSFCHRSIICASLARGKSEVNNICFSKDIIATIGAMKALGTKIERNKDSAVIYGTGGLSLKSDTIFCGESGSTLRFIIPLAASMDQRIILTGQGKLVERPLDIYYKIFKEQNIYYKNSNGKLPLEINGSLKPGSYKIQGDISSQFITGLLFILPLLKGNSEIELTTNLESRPYIDMTLKVLKKFGINIENMDYKKFIIPGNQSYKSGNYIVEGDFSQAAFLLAIGVLGNGVVCEGLDISSSQGDKVILDFLKRMGAIIEVNDGNIISKASEIRGITVDASQCPDLVPSLAALASVSSGTTRIVNAGRLRIKESDRLAAISSQLNKIGADVEEKPDGLVIKGRQMLQGGEVRSFNDHRIAMALAQISSRCKNNLIIHGSDCVSKSYPGFWDDFRILGGNIERI